MLIWKLFRFPCKRVSCGMQASPCDVQLTQLADPQMPSIPLPQICTGHTTNCRAYYSTVLRPFSDVQACLKYLPNAEVMLSN